MFAIEDYGGTTNRNLACSTAGWTVDTGLPGYFPATSHPINAIVMYRTATAGDVNASFTLWANPPTVTWGAQTSGNAEYSAFCGFFLIRGATGVGSSATLANTDGTITMPAVSTVANNALKVDIAIIPEWDRLTAISAASGTETLRGNAAFSNPGIGMALATEPFATPTSGIVRTFNATGTIDRNVTTSLVINS